jgi:alcohol dehydrogenase class IV
MELKVKRMAGAMEMKDHSVAAFIAEIERRLDEIDIPKSLDEIGVPMDCAHRIAQKACVDSAASTNPRAATVDQIRTLTETAIKKAR